MAIESTGKFLSNHYLGCCDKFQIVGPPDNCIQQIADLRCLIDMNHLAAAFSFGGMQYEEADLNMRLFADRAMLLLNG